MCSRKQARRASRPGAIPAHNLISSAVQGLTVSCAVALDTNSMRAAQIIRVIFIIDALTLVFIATHAQWSIDPVP